MTVTTATTTALDDEFLLVRNRSFHSPARR